MLDFRFTAIEQIMLLVLHKAGTNRPRYTGKKYTLDRPIRKHYRRISILRSSKSRTELAKLSVGTQFGLVALV